MMNLTGLSFSKSAITVILAMKLNVPKSNSHMKSLKLIMIVLLLATVAKANDTEKGQSNTPEANIFTHGTDMVFVQLQNPINHKIKIAIVDQDGVVLHSETIKKDLKVLKRFDMSQLPSGQYSYRISSDSYAVSKKIEKN